MYRVACHGANLIKMSLVTTAAMLLAICLLALVETTNTAEAKDSLPENGKIAFSSSDGSIYTVEPDGSNLRQLTTYGQYPNWSPDGTKVAFAKSSPGGREHISIIGTDGSNLRNIHSRVSYGGTQYPTWSPDGTKLAFISNGDIYVTDLDGSNQINLTNTPEYFETFPDFSPSGSQMCFFRFNNIGQAKPATGFYVMDDDGSDPILLGEVDWKAPRSHLGAECHWSPDGTKIAFHADASSGDGAEGGDSEKALKKALKKALAEGNSQKALEKAEQLRALQDDEVYVINTDGSGQTALTSNSAADVTPNWSPDGTKITFASDRDGGYWDIYTMDADGSDVAQLTNAPYDDLDPDWQPLPGTTPPKDADGPDVAQVTKKPGADDVHRDRPERTVIVKPGYSLWSIGEQKLGPNASPQQVYEHTLLMYALNRDRIGPDPNLIFWGQRLLLPSLGEH